MLRGVRGATTAIANEPEAVRTATKNLLVAMTKANAVKPSDIAAVIFSSTPDLNAAFPASAAREMGWNEVPLFGTQEIDSSEHRKTAARNPADLSGRRGGAAAGLVGGSTALKNKRNGTVAWNKQSRN